MSRELGPRGLNELPPSEMALTTCRLMGGPRDHLDDEVLRTVLAAYGRSRASQNFVERLTHALETFGATAV